MRAEAWALNDDDARDISEKLNVFLAMFHSAEASVGSPGNDADIKAFFYSLQVRLQDNRVVLLAAIPTEVIRKLAQSPSEIPSLSTPPEPAPEPAKKAKTH